MAFQTIDLGVTVTSGSLASGTFSIGGMTFTVSTGVTVTQESGRLKFSENIANGDFILTVVEDGGDGNFSFESAFLDSNSTGGDPGSGPQLSFVAPGYSQSVINFWNEKVVWTVLPGAT